jgi:hypothetical protein
VENQKNQQLSTVELVARSLINPSINYAFTLADESFLSYSLELVGSAKRPLTFSCSFSTYKLSNGIPRGEEIEICQLIVYGDQVGIDIKNKKSLPKKACQTINVNGVSRLIATHADVIIFRAIPEWMTKAASLVSRYEIEPIWLITVNLLKQSKFQVDALWNFDKEKTNFSPFSKEDFSRAVIVSQEQAHNVPRLQNAITHIPEWYEELQEFQFKQDEIITPVERYIEPPFYEYIMDERKAEGRDLGGAK